MSGNRPARIELGVIVSAMSHHHTLSARTFVALMAALGMALVGLAPASAVQEPLESVPVPVISGAFKAGQILTGTPVGHSTPQADTYMVVWFLDGVEWGTGPEFTLYPSSGGKQVSAVTRAFKDGYANTDSAPTESQVVDKGTQASFVPKVVGALGVGIKLKVRGLPEGGTYRYQWLSGGKPITKATSRVYKLALADVGKKISVKVTSEREGYSDLTKTSAATAAVKKPFTKMPAPKISGSAKVGTTLTAKTAPWSPKVTLKHQWYRDTVAIPKATKSTYKVVAADVGRRISVRVTGAKSGLLGGATSTSKMGVKGTITAPKPKITGTTRAGHTLKVSLGASKPSGLSKTCQWHRNGHWISGATKATYALKNEDAGKKITVTVTYSKAGYNTKPVTSVATKAIAKRSASMAGTGRYSAKGATGAKKIAAGTYFTTATSSSCKWARDNNNNASDGAIARGGGEGRWVVTIPKSDAYFRTTGCGPWLKWDGTGSQSKKITKDGLYRVGVELKAGLYTGGGGGIGPCVVSFEDSASNRASAVYESLTIEYGPLLEIYSEDTWFRTVGCGTWTREGSNATNYSRLLW